MSAEQEQVRIYAAACGGVCLETRHERVVLSVEAFRALLAQHLAWPRTLQPIDDAPRRAAAPREINRWHLGST